LERRYNTRHFSRDPGDGCPFCGGDPDESLKRHNSDLSKKLENAHNQIELMKDRLGLQENVIKDRQDEFMIT